MGVDLIGAGRSVFSANWSYWRHCLRIASAFGWVPAGTIAPEEWSGEESWCGTYFSNDLQKVLDHDAKSLAQALDHARDALANYDPLTADQMVALRSYPDGEPISRALASYLESVEGAMNEAGIFPDPEREGVDSFKALARFARKGAFVIG